MIALLKRLARWIATGCKPTITKDPEEKFRDHQPGAPTIFIPKLRWVQDPKTDLLHPVRTHGMEIMNIVASIHAIEGGYYWNAGTFGCPSVWGAGETYREAVTEVERLIGVWTFDSETLGRRRGDAYE